MQTDLFHSYVQTGQAVMRNHFVPSKTFNWYQMPNQSYFVPHKTFSRDKTRTTCRPHLPTHQDNHTGNRHPSTTTSLTSATRPCTPIRQTKRQRNGSTDMDTVPRKIGIQRIIRADPPPDCPKSPRETEIPRTPIQGRKRILDSH